MCTPTIKKNPFCNFNLWLKISYKWFPQLSFSIVA
jgi:hypothetical protein